jgi:hypothetical protein
MKQTNKIRFADIPFKNTFRPGNGAEIPNKIPIYNPNGIEPDIDDFLDSVNLPSNWTAEDCVLHLHPYYREVFHAKEEECKEISGFTGKFTRYRNFLLLFEEDIPRQFLYISSIFDEIENLKRLLNDATYEFSEKDHQRLKYLRNNRYIKR